MTLYELIGGPFDGNHAEIDDRRKFWKVPIYRDPMLEEDWMPAAWQPVSVTVALYKRRLVRNGHSSWYEYHYVRST